MSGIKNNPLITPCVESKRAAEGRPSYGLSGVGYDLSFSGSWTRGRFHRAHEVRTITHPLKIAHGRFALIGMREYIQMPLNVIGIVGIKSSWAREGMLVPPTFIQPGWNGHLTVEVFNGGPDTLELFVGDGIVTVVFARLDTLAEPYQGVFQDQKLVNI